MAKNLLRINQKLQKCKPPGCGQMCCDDAGWSANFQDPLGDDVQLPGTEAGGQQPFLLSRECRLAAFTVPPCLWNFSLEANICCIRPDSSMSESVQC